MTGSPASSIRGGFPLGLAGATAATRYVGATASGAPASGTFAVGDFVIDQTGKVYVCTVAGSPGTWTQAGGTAQSATLFDSTLSGDAASIDTGANGIAAGYFVLEAWILGRTTEATVGSSINVTLNNDGGANYDLEAVRGINVTASATVALAATAWNLSFFGASAQAGAASLIRLTIPSYTQTTFHKMVEATESHVEDTAADCRVLAYGLRYRSTTAISRMAVAAGSGNLLAGSRLLILGRGV